jgi:hypothetical protein
VHRKMMGDGRGAALNREAEVAAAFDSKTGEEAALRRSARTSGPRGGVACRMSFGGRKMGREGKRVTTETDPF